MPLFGAHMSIKGGLHTAIERGLSIACQTIQLFLRNNARWQAKPRRPEELALYRDTLAQSGIAPVLAHAIYLINLASPDQEIYRRSTAAFDEELARCHEAAFPYLVLHPGSHRGSGLEAGIARIADSINRAYARHPEYTVVTLLENTAGLGDTIGRTFEELALLAAGIEDRSRIGYCFDTAHALASGLEFRTPEGYAETWARFDALLGLDKLHGFHLNDSQCDLGGVCDRHEHIGEGYVGLEGFRRLVNDPRFADIPMVLETPKGDDLYEDVENLARLYSLIE
jgi:deoxyribonuclease-4